MKNIDLLFEQPKLKTKILEYYPIAGSVTVKGMNPWDAAHKYRIENTLDILIEPNIDSSLYTCQREKQLIKKSGIVKYLYNWPKPPLTNNSFIWHLLEEYSQLESAKKAVWNKVGVEKCIKIAHIDTGYQLGHPALPRHLDEGISFLKGENHGPAIDIKRNSFQEQDGHGTATMSILAGKRVFFSQHGITYDGDFGAIPFAEIIPIRISDTVALIRTQNFVKAVYYAVERGCEVISMSMAGAPTKQWSEAINFAYESGVTMVTASGNSWNSGGKKFLPKKTLYPARWDRVISATGVTSNQYPYVFKAQVKIKSEGGETMQGNYGPKKVMDTSLAAYTPNTVWATMNEFNKNILYRFDGGGTSSATPQVAAAAALWLSYHRSEIEENLKIINEPWRKVEAVKYALFKSADKSYEDYKKYYGQGILKARNALEIFPDWNELMIAKKAKTSLDGILDFLQILLRIKNDAIVNKNQFIQDEMFTIEILQLLHTNQKLHSFLEIDDDELWSNDKKSELLKFLVESENSSLALKKRLKSIKV